MIIGLVGFKQVGKSTAAEYLAEKHGFTRINFKDALVEDLRVRFPDLVHEIITILEKEYWEGKPWTFDRLVQEKPPLFRALMQNYGTEVRRKDNKDYWTNEWLDKMVGGAGLFNVVVDDVRFLNEAKAVKSQSGIIVRLVRPDVHTGGGHQSETEQLSIEADYTIAALKGEYERLYAYLDAIVEEDKKPPNGAFIV